MAKGIFTESDSEKKGIGKKTTKVINSAHQKYKNIWQNKRLKIHIYGCVSSTSSAPFPLSRTNIEKERCTSDLLITIYTSLIFIATSNQM